MNKWYTDPKTDNSVIISSRIRLARNHMKYPFALMLKDDDAELMIKETIQSVGRAGCSLHYIELNNKSTIEKLELLEKHIISSEFLKSKKRKATLVQENCEINIMLNEEDHIRIQSVKPGGNINDAWDTANKIDDLIEETIAYAFDKDFGYLTTCPTNTGTGLRASFMMHLPLLEKTGQLRNILQALSTFGMTVRGIYGEGTESLGSIYQISNQLTLGKSEQEIISNLENVTNQITEKEKWLWEKATVQKNVDVEDGIYRSYGILTHCKSIAVKEAMHLLSQIRLGYVTGILDMPKPKLNIYHMMMNIQPGSLQMQLGTELPEDQLDSARATYIQSIL